MSTEKKDLGHLPAGARMYILALYLTAILVNLVVPPGWKEGQLGQFLFFLTCGVLCSNMKVYLPGVTGTLSVNYIFVLTAATELSLPYTVAIGTVSGVAQLFWAARKKPRLVQVAFTCASMGLTCAMTFQAYHAEFLSFHPAFRLFWASITYFLLNTGTVAGIITLTEGKNIAKVWRDNFFWTAPHYLVGGTVAGVLHLWDEAFGWQSSVLVLPTIYLIYHSYNLYLKRLAEEKRHVGAMADLHLRTIQSLALAIDARDGTTHAHLRRVQVYARELARELGLPETERRALDAAALLHDIGKLAVPEYIISKPGKLTPEEFEKMKIHPIVGAEILESVQFPDPVAPIVRAHHEKWDGSGYPYGLKGNEIPIGARIVSVVDCLDALASDRQYRRALSLEEALAKVVEESGTSFDPRVVSVLQRRYLEFEEIARKQVAGGSVLSTNIKVQRGGPAAGFESSAPAPNMDPKGFIAKIAAAREEFHTLLELTHELGSTLRVDETLSLLTTRLRKLIPFDGVAIYIEDGKHLRTQYASGEDAALFLSLQIPVGEGISGWVTQNAKPMINGNPSVEPGYLNDQTKFSIHRSALSVPLIGLEGVIGALTLYHRASSAFTQDHLRVLLAASSKAGLTIENALRFGTAEESATTDGLTSLPNARSLFHRLSAELERAELEQTPLAVVVTDLDGFKQVNDQFGHTTGNRVLEETAKALRRCVREGDYVARMGGDEFVLLLPSVDSPTVKHRLEQLEKTVPEAGREVCPGAPVGLSVGVAFYPQDATNAEELLARADARMYEMKRRHHAEADVSCAGSSMDLSRMATALQKAEPSQERSAR